MRRAGSCEGQEERVAVVSGKWEEWAAVRLKRAGSFDEQVRRVGSCEGHVRRMGHCEGQVRIVGRCEGQMRQLDNIVCCHRKFRVP